MRALTFAIASLVLCHAAPAHADEVHDAVEAYALYQNDVSVLLDMEVDSARVINGALTRLSRHEPERVARGFIAYGAMTAAQSPAFAAGVERRQRNLGRSQLLTLLRSDTTYARNEAPGSPQAIQLILGVARADAARADIAGDRYHQLARSSTASWVSSPERRSATLVSARLTPEMRERLRIGALEARPMNEADEFGGRGFWDALAGREASGPRIRGAREQRGYADVTNRMLTVGALIVTGAADAERRRVSDLLDEPITEQCLTMQRLQLRQCLSVSVDASERTYCLGRHGLTGPGSCFSAMVQ
ncbi:MAG: hypothetical protein K2P58_05405 [Hyphomonadaceae bacterium]|nr:hypothetical protein [Hyphomonadaceae bacterium]